MPQSPNILVITTHDSGCHFGCYGVPTVHTPHIDALAADGVRFTRMYATAPICSPSRASLMTGQYPARHGLMGLTGVSRDGTRNWGGRMAEPSHHLSQTVRRSGYQSVLFGHQHEIGEPDVPGHDLVNPAPDDGAGPLTSHAAAAVAVRFAQWVCGRSRDKPFFAQVGFFETHTPYDHEGVQPDRSRGVWVPPYCQSPSVRKAFNGLSGALKDAQDDQALQNHLAMFQGSLRAADHGVGVILQSLREAGNENDTLVIFNTDHGPELPHAKWTVHDAGCRIAFILRWPGGNVGRGAVCDHLLSNADFVPTLTELVGLDVRHPVDGVSFANSLADPAAHVGPRDEVLSYMHYGNVYSLRTSRYNLIRCLKGGVQVTDRGYRTRCPFEMFDTERDPLELNDVSNDPAYATDFQKLAARFWKSIEALDDPILRTPPEI
ncbi:MAG: sulfatase [Planctomycetota bacterium]|nr:sulfatase [Planctomycetota bacterium]